MKTVAFVPVKLINERFPGKNTKCFSDGTALITHFLKSLLRVKGIDQVYVFGSDDVIREYLPQKVVFKKRPQWLDAQKATPQDIISEFMKVIDADIYAVCHCTAPFVTEVHLGECIEAVKHGGFDSSFTAERIQRLMWTDKNKPMNFNPANIPRTQDLPVYYSEVSAAYVFQREVFLKYKRRVGIHPHITVISGIECIDIDYREDFELANMIYMNIIKTRGGRKYLKTFISLKVIQKPFPLWEVL